jgi:tRNA(fMet)-specific endonuclease VapC
MQYMLDTNACIGAINGSPAVVRERLLQVSPSDVAISQIVLYELEFGVCRSRNQERNRAELTLFLKYVLVLDWSAEQTGAAADIRCELTRLGRPIGAYDTLIAAHARSIAAILVTHSTREFSRVPGLNIDDWELP